MAAAAAAFVLCAPLASANDPLYRYTDSNGVVHFTNVPASDKYHRVSITRDGVVRAGGAKRVRNGQPPQHESYDALIERVAGAYGLEPALVKAVIAAESNFDARAVSHKGALGLMQLMPRTARLLGVDNPKDPSDNVLGGARYLREMLDRYGDLSRALAAYNAGPKAVDRYRGVPPYRETREYVARVLHYYRGYYRDFAGR